MSKNKIIGILMIIGGIISFILAAVIDESGLLYILKNDPNSLIGALWLLAFIALIFLMICGIMRGAWYWVKDDKFDDDEEYF